MAPTLDGWARGPSGSPLVLVQETGAGPAFATSSSLAARPSPLRAGSQAAPVAARLRPALLLNAKLSRQELPSVTQTVAPVTTRATTVTPRSQSIRHIHLLSRDAVPGNKALQVAFAPKTGQPLFFPGNVR